MPPTPGPAELKFEPTKEPNPNRYNLGLRFGTCYAPHCIMRTGLLLCSGCRAVRYCSVEHQRADRPRHKSQCKLIKPARDELARLEADLRADAAPTDPFADRDTRGNFYSIFETRPYMQKRHHVMSATLNIRSGESLEEALGHCMEMLQLSKGDNLGVRGQVPPLLLRLGRDQEAYDFIKWWNEVPRDYGYGDPSLPFLDLHGADALEPWSEAQLRHCVSLSHLVSLANLKIRLLRDVRMLLGEARKPASAGTVDYEKRMEWVREDACSDVLYGRRDVVEYPVDRLAELERDLDSQVRAIHRRVDSANKHYWPALKHPERYSHALPTMYSPGSPQEVILVFRYTWYMWSEDELSLNLVKSLS